MSSFACTCVDEAGYNSPKSAAARSWLKWGVELDGPRLGCIVVFDRSDPSNPNAAHVAFYAQPSFDTTKILVLGGNQRNRVCVAPYDKEKVLGYRWPRAAPLTANL